MDITALFQLSYGIYYITSHVGEKQAGCVVNTVFQLTADPVTVGVSVAKENQTYEFIKKTGTIGVTIVGESADSKVLGKFGYRSGRDVDKFKETGLTREKADIVSAPMIQESPVSIECRVKEIKELGSNHMFLADVVAVHADEHYMDENNRFDLNLAKPLVYSHGEYMGTGKQLGTFGYSVKKKKKTSQKASPKGRKA